MKKSLLITIGALLTPALVLAAQSLTTTAAPSAQDVAGFNTLRDVVIPLANMGIGAIIAILLIWQIFPILNRNTETLKEIAATLDVISNNNLRLAEKLLDIIEKQSMSKR
jgi:hypothetical protein